MKLKSLKLKSSDLPLLRKAACQVLNARVSEILDTLADNLQEGVSRQEDEVTETTLHPWGALWPS